MAFDKEINFIKRIIITACVLANPNALAVDNEQMATSEDNTAGTVTFRASSSSVSNGDSNYAYSQMRSATSSLADNSWINGSGITSQASYDSDADNSSVVIQLGASADGFCTGGSNDQCGAQIEMRQTSTAGVRNDSTIIAKAAKMYLSGEINLRSVGDNGASVSNLAEYVRTNRTNLTTNETAIATNATNVAANVTDIAANETAIATNATNISTYSDTLLTHSAAIDNIQSSFANYQAETMANFERMGSKMHKGLAEVTALSNVSYAENGWRASVGYGDYESKSAAAFGVSYAGKKYKFKISRSGKATGAGLAFDF